MTRATIRAALAAFFVSRGLIFFLIVFLSQMAFEGKDAGLGVWHTRVDLQGPRVVPELLRMATIGDAGWYTNIAENGYARRPFDLSRQETWAFFPLYPLVMRYARVTPHHPLNGIIISNLSFLGALLLLGGIARNAGLTDEDAERATWYLALFPTSYFCFLPLPEGLFLLLSLGAVYAAQRQKWWAMGVLGGLAALTRLNGALLVIPLTLLAWRKAKGKVAWVALVPAGTFAYMAWLYHLTGNAWAFRDIQPLWYRQPGAFWRPLMNYLQQPALISDPWNFILLNFLVAVAVLIAAVILLLRRDWAFGLYTLASILLPLSAGNLQSVARYAVVLFPVFLLLAIAGRRSTLDRAVMAGGAILLGWMVALFALRVDMALA